MPKIDLTISVTAILGIAAIVSPVLTTLLNNHHLFRIKKLELKQNEYEQTVLYKRNIFEQFLQGLSQLSQYQSEEHLALYSKYYPLAYMYLPSDVQKTLSELNLLILSKSWKEIGKYVDRLTTEIYTVLKAL